MQRINHHDQFWKQEQFRLIVEYSNDLIITTDSKGNFLYVSPSHKKILGYTQKELLGKNAFSLIHPKDKEYAVSQFQKAFRKERLSIHEFTAIHKDGHNVILEATASAVYPADLQEGVPIFVAIMRDITQKRKVELKKEEFVNVAHNELKIPINSISLFMKMINRYDNQLSPETRKYLELLDSEILRLRNLASKLALFSEIQLGVVHIKKSPVLINPFIQKIMLTFSSSERKIKIISEDKEIVAQFDEGIVKEILHQIIENAIKFSPSSSVVNIRILKQKKMIRIEIEDFGIGIRNLEYDYLRERFFHSDFPAVYKNPGFGLGFYVTSVIMEMHGGYLEIINKKEDGIIVALCFPEK